MALALSAGPRKPVFKTLERSRETAAKRSAVSGDGRVIVGFTYDQNYRTLPFRWTQADGMKLVPLPDDRRGGSLGCVH